MANRPALERSLVVLAGPIYNFILAFFIFTIVGLFIPKQSDTVSAQIAELNTENFYEVVAVNNVEINTVQGLEVKLLDLTGYSGNVEIELFDYTNQKEITFNKEVKDLKFAEGQSPSSYFGMKPYADFEPRINVIQSDSIAEKIGFKSGDVIKTIFQEDIKSMYQATSLLNTVGRQIPIVVS